MTRIQFLKILLKQNQLKVENILSREYATINNIMKMKQILQLLQCQSSVFGSLPLGKSFLKTKFNPI